MSEEVDAEAKGFTEIKIVGVGGGGNNALNRMIEAGIRGVDFVAVNTDAQALEMSAATHKIPIGGKAMKRLGAGGDPMVGERAAEISRDQLEEALAGADMVFITAGMGGGTGTGASPVIAEIARKNRSLTVAVVTLPFTFEGRHRRLVADQGYEILKERVDAIIAIPNDRLRAMANKRMGLLEAFRMADNILRQGVQGMSDLITVTGLINLDFADVKSIMSGSGTALMAIGEGKGPARAVQAAQAAIESPLLDVSITGATGLLINVTGGPDMSLIEVSEAASLISEAASPEANIILGAVIHPKPQAEMQVTLIATGFGRTETRKAEVKVSDVFAKLDASLDEGLRRVDRELLDAHEPEERREPREIREFREPRELPDQRDLDIPAFLRKRKPQ
ncbi:MAG: cell division protein FtsZ [Chloroflexi bacterium]|nr:cell division protein FtsZ [Chloroflexota bacterium]